LLQSFAMMALWLAVLVFAMAEAAFRFASRSRLEELIENPRRRARYMRYLDRDGLMHAMCVLLRVLVMVALTLLVGLEMSARHGLLATGAVAAVALLAAELPGRLLGRKWSANVLVIVLPPLRLASLVLEPFQMLLERTFPRPQQHPDEEVVEAAKEEIRVAVEDGATEGALEAGQVEMIEGILKFRDAQVDEVMTPRTDMECLEVNTPLGEAISAIESFRHSRIPLFQETQDRVVGIVYVKDLLPLAHGGQGAAGSLKDVMRRPYFVPETKRVGELLREFQKRHVQIAIVVDEYGGVNGLVTVEDIMEEIVGEIEDEYDEENHEEWIKTLSAGSLEVDGRVRIDEVNELLGTDLPEDENYDTIGGFAMATLARVPSVGESFRSGPLMIKVLQGDDRRVKRLLLNLVEEGRGE